MRATLRKRRRSKTTSHNAPQSSSHSETSNIDHKQTRKQQLSRWKILFLIAPLLFFLAFWKHRSKNEVDPIYNFLAQFVCQDLSAYCHPNLEAIPSRRTHRASSDIPPSQPILILPRKFLILDLDALEDSFIQTELFGAKHKTTKKGLDSGAYLAAFLNRRVKLSNESLSWLSQDYMRPFFEILPTYESLLPHHPTLWNETSRQTSLGNKTLIAKTVQAFLDMMMSEYEAFTSQSSQFAAQFSLQEYLAARINVMSRSFGTGPPSSDEITPKQLQSYKEQLGVDLNKGCRAMSPILDMWDHHANPNVIWKYIPQKHAFVIQSSKTIPKHHDIMVSYGRYTDTHLFSKFGFVNGDGSGWTEASLAVFHDLCDVGLKHQFSYCSSETTLPPPETLLPLMKYLQYDENCISPSSSRWKFQVLKLHHLRQIANVRSRWVFQVQPRNSTSMPAKSSNIPITKQLPRIHRNMKLDARQVISTCRLITLREDDYDNQATKTLQDYLKNNTILFIKKQNENFEYRALHCLERLTTLALTQYPTLELKGINFQSRGWNAMHVLLGEVQSLDVLRGVVRSGMTMMENRIKKEFPRKERCEEEREYSLEMLMDVSLED